MKKQKKAVGKQQTMQNKVEESNKIPEKKGLPEDLQKDECLNKCLAKKEKLEIFLFLAAVFIVFMIPNGYVSLTLAMLCLIFTLRKSSLEVLREHLSLPVVGIAMLLLLYGASAALMPATHAMELEWYRGLCYFSLSVFVLLRFRKRHVPTLLWGMTGVWGAISLLTLEGAAMNLLYERFGDFTGLFGGTLGEIDAVVGGRLNGIMNNANATAGLVGMLLLVGLYQLRTAETQKERFAAAALLGINGVAFWLNLSRGALLVFCISLLVYLIFTKKGQRISMFMTMAVSGVPILLCGLVAQSFLGVGSIIPLAASLLCGPVIFLLEKCVNPVARFFEGRIKLIWISGGVLAVFAAAAIFVAMTVTGPAVLHSGDMYVRVVDLQPGESYTAELDCDGDPEVLVYTRNQQEAIMQRETTLYYGPKDQVSFSVPADARVVYIQLRPEETMEVRSIVFSDGTETRLDYRFLPASIEDRLQDPLLNSISFLLRVQYVKDAVKIWSEAPLFGRGLSSTDTWYTNVQPFFYQSQFVHNHFVQYLTDLGVVGLAAFLLVVGGVVWLLLRKRKEENGGFAAAFLAVMVMMNLHSAMEINFSVRAYAVMAYLMISIVIILCEDPIPFKGKEAVKKATMGLAGACWAFLLVFGGLGIVSQAVAHIALAYTTTSFDKYMSALETYIAFDVYDDAYYKTLYLAEGTHSPQHTQKASEYAQEMWDMGQYTYCDAAARYYYLPSGHLEEMFACSRTGIAQKASDPESWNGQLDFYRATVMPALQPEWDHWVDRFLDGVVLFHDELLMFNDGRMDPIVLSADNQAFLDLAVEIYRNPDMDAAEAYQLMDQYSEADSEW